MDPNVALIYGPRYREFAVPEQSIGEAGPSTGWITPFKGISVEFDWCPWSGRPLPGGLRDQLFDIIENELGLSDFSVLSPISDLPEEYRSDEWWRKRGIGADPPVLHKDWRKPSIVQFRIPPPHPDLPPGYGHPPGLLPHACEDIVLRFEDCRVLVGYLPQVREYGFRITNPVEPLDLQEYRIAPIRFCPWCGDALPTSLRTEREARLKDLGLTPDADNIPPDFGTDAWWRNEGI